MRFQDQPLSYFTSLSSKDVLAELDSSEDGLPEKEVRQRLLNFGSNILVSDKKKNWVVQYVATFKNPLVLILLFASVVSLFLGETIDAVLISTIVMLSTLLNFIQEYSANKAAQKLREKVMTMVTVLRDNKEQTVKMTDICVGDIITLSAGNLVPADARIMSAKDFFVNQSALTGESFPIEKTADTNYSHDTSLGNLNNIILSGSNVVTGTACAVVIKTGKDTEFGKIGTSLTESTVPNEFTLGIKNLSILIMRLTIFFVLFIFFFNTVIKHTSIFDSFTFAVALAVGLTPELLPMIMSINMAKGSLKMAKKGVIVKKLTAIPNFGSMDVLCTDKTGTLTEAHIELIKYVDVFGKHSEHVLLNAYLNSFYQTGIKNPMDDAIISYKREDIHMYKKRDEIPFDFVRKKSRVVVDHNNKHYLITKGAPEEIFHASTFYRENGEKKEFTHEKKEQVKKLYKDLSQEGFRVLAIAVKNIEKRDTYTYHDEHSLELLGFIAFLDPAKKDVKEVLARLSKMGIEPKVITGDNELVTQKICADVGLSVKGVLLGHQLETLTDDALKVVVEKTTIFARFSPDQKNRIITVLQKNGHVVGYMGDGINDAPSLSASDVGISVNTAVDIAKESADIILTHKSLRELEEGVLDGRTTFANTMKYIMMSFSSNSGNMFSVLGAVLFIPFLPMLSIQILLNNLLYDLSQITLPSDNVDKEFIDKPRRWNVSFIRNFMLVFGPLSSIFDFLTFFILYGLFSFSAHMFQTGWFLESLATQTLVIHVIRTRHTPFFHTTASKYLLATTFGIIGIGCILPYTEIGSFFNFVPLPANILLIIALITALNLVTVEGVKRLFYKRFAF